MLTPLRALNVTPLMQAAFSTATPVETLLELARTHDPQATDQNGRTALMLAAWQGGAAKVRALLPLSDPRQVDERGVNALMIAAGMGDPERVAALLPVSDPQARDQDGMNALMHAVRNAKVDHVPMLSLVCPADLRDRSGDTLLAYALKAGPRTLQTVLSLVPVDLRNHQGQTALMLAAQAPSRAAQVLLPILLAAGADPLLTDDHGMTALHHASRTSEAALDLLWDVSDPAAKDHQGRTVLHHAARGTSTPALGTVLDHWPKHRVDEPDANGRTPLGCLCEGSLDVRSATLLLAAGADPNATDADGEPPLLAAIRRHVEDTSTEGMATLHALLKAGAQVPVRGPHGEGLLDLLQVDADEGTMTIGSWDVLGTILPFLPTSTVQAWAHRHGLLDLSDPESDDHDRRQALHQRLVLFEQQALASAITAGSGGIVDPIAPPPRSRL